MNLIEVAYQFIEYLRGVKFASEHTIRNYSIDLNALKEYIEIQILQTPKEEVIDKIHYLRTYEMRASHVGEDKFPITSLTRRMVSSYIIWLYEQKLNKKSIRRHLCSLRTFLKYCVIQELLTENPAAEIIAPKDDKHIPAPLSYSQIQNLFDQPNTQKFLGFRDRTMLEVFYSSGLRVSELVGLNRSDLDLKQLLIRVFGKRRKERIVPITKNAADWLTAYLTHAQRFLHTPDNAPEVDHEAIFLNHQGTRITTRSVDRLFAQILAKSGIPGHVTPHDIRHTIATHWLENGMDLKTIQLLLGHQCLATTTIYTQVSNKLKQTVYDASHPHAHSQGHNRNPEPTQEKIEDKELAHSN